ncbi:TPA: hypothetical protein DD450_04670 [Candidatus Woesebacteria bacterium]|nr:hypothetical protein [Candidatus Woesebacteria bacterium]
MELIGLIFWIGFIIFIIVIGGRISEYITPKATGSNKKIQELKCPKCSSTNFTANNKGFGLGKAAVGGVLLGPVGLLGGLVGSKNAVFVCLKCGNQFEK